MLSFVMHNVINFFYYSCPNAFMMSVIQMSAIYVKCCVFIVMLIVDMLNVMAPQNL